MAKTFLVVLAPVVSCWISENFTHNHTLDSASSEISINYFFLIDLVALFSFKKIGERGGNFIWFCLGPILTLDAVAERL